MRRIGIYPGTFDPITNGHIDVIKRSLKIVDKLIIAVSNDYSKEYLFEPNIDKFETKLHLRVVPLDGKKQWIAFSSFTNKPVEPKSDDGIWDINESDNKHLSFASLD